MGGGTNQGAVDTRISCGCDISVNMDILVVSLRVVNRFRLYGQGLPSKPLQTPDATFSPDNKSLLQIYDEEGKTQQKIILYSRHFSLF